MNFKASDSCRSRCYSTALEDRNLVLEEASSLIFSGVPVCLLTHLSQDLYGCVKSMWCSHEQGLCT